MSPEDLASLPNKLPKNRNAAVLSSPGRALLSNLRRPRTRSIARCSNRH